LFSLSLFLPGLFFSCLKENHGSQNLSGQADKIHWFFRNNSVSRTGYGWIFKKHEAVGKLFLFLIFG